MSEGDRVVVVGGGVAGLCTAYYLAKRGAAVTVLESNRVGSGASAGNGGWLCPAQAGPLPEPGLTLTGMRALLNRDSALYFKPCNAAPALAVAAALLVVLQRKRVPRRGRGRSARSGGASSASSRTMADGGVEFELHRQGMLIAAQRS